MALPVGEHAPDFTLKTRKDGQNTDIRLSANYGSKATVLLFFPGVFTHVCHKEMCDFTDNIGAYNALNAQVYGISNDSPFAQEEWAKQLKIAFPLLSDFQKSVAKSYDVV